MVRFSLSRSAVGLVLGLTLAAAVTAVTLAMTPAPAAAQTRGPDRFMKNARQLSFEGRRSGEQYFSPDGTKLVFMSERVEGNPFFQIFTLDFETGDIAQISPGTGKATCPYFQAGTGNILFASTHLDPDFATKAAEEYKRREEDVPRRGSWDYDETYDLFVFDRSGKELMRLTTELGYDAEGSYSPDGTKIVFASNRIAWPPDTLTEEERARQEKQPDFFLEIYTMNADGTNVQRLTHWPGYDGGPFFTPDGERIVWRHFTEDGMLADVYTMKLDGSDLRRLTDFKAMSWAPIFHPTGEYAIFVSNKLGFDNFELFLVDRLGEREPVRVTYTEKFDGLPVFSPDGTRIVWVSNNTDTGLSQMFLADWDHAAVMQALAEAPKADHDPADVPAGVTGVR